MSTARARLLAAAGAGLGGLVLLAAPASAHPLGNFSLNRYAGLVVAADAVSVDYVVDAAEIPTQQSMPEIDADGDGTPTRAELAGHAAARCRELLLGLDVAVAGEAVALAAVRGGASAALTPGQAGLPTLRIECRFEGAADAADAEISFTDRNLADRVGWREVTASGDGIGLRSSDVPAVSVSDRLREYPAGADLPRVDGAAILAGPAGSAAGIGVPRSSGSPLERAVPGGDRAAGWLTSLVAERALTPWFAVWALAVAGVLGALHAFAPGHGKTVMAAYVLGQRHDGLRQALRIGVVVAATHTAGVLTLGFVLVGLEVAAPERLYPLLGAASGLAVAGVGASIVWRVARAIGRGEHTGHSHGTGPGQHSHAWLELPEPELVLTGAGAAPVHHHDQHGHGHGHGHDRGPGHAHPHAHDHAPDHAPDGHGTATNRRRIAAELPATGTRSAWALGFAGGLVPSPSAVVVLLGAVALGRTWFGLVLVGAYGLGMAAALLGAAFLVLRTRTWIAPRLGGRTIPFTRWLPLVSGVAVTGGGLLIALRALA